MNAEVQAFLDGLDAQEERPLNRPGQNLARVLQHAPANRSRRLTSEETEWALRIQRAMRDDPDLDPPSAFWIAQVSLCLAPSDANVRVAIEKAHALQGFREEYDIVETTAQGVRAMEEFFETNPGFFLAIFNDPVESPSWAIDFSQSQGYAKRSSIRAYYYVLQACHADLEQIREGLTIQIECRGFDWTRNFGWKEFSKWFYALGSWYPSRKKQISAFHSGTMVNVILSMVRKLLPRHERDKLEYGCTSPVGPLPRFYFIPTPEAARQRILTRVRDGLTRRYANEASFALGEGSSPPRAAARPGLRVAGW